MPANLTPQYIEAEQHFKEAKTIPEKLAALEEMLATIPKHKGTEKLQADIKRRISKLKNEQQAKKGPAREKGFFVEKEGAGQVVLAGIPNSGKSSILSLLTNAIPEIADYPFTTRMPLPGMMEFENIKIQIVDLPPIDEQITEPWVMNIIRNGDAVLLVVDMSDDSVIDSLDTLLKIAANSKIYFNLRDFISSTAVSKIFKKTALVANKMDKEDAGERLKILKDFYGDSFTVYEISCKDNRNLEQLKRVIFDLLDIIRIYTKMPGKAPEKSKPFIAKKNDTVLDVASMVHKDFAFKLKYARIWGSQKYPGQMVQKDYVLHDEDVVEFHI